VPRCGGEGHSGNLSAFHTEKLRAAEIVINAGADYLKTYRLFHRRSDRSDVALLRASPVTAAA